jgi:subtilisin-like proprotein convertase family protein
LAGGLVLLMMSASAFGQASWSSTGGVAINDNSTASPYPSEIEVKDMQGNVEKVTVTLNGLTHSYPADIAILLVSPDGARKVVLTADAGSLPVTGVTLTFDDAAGGSLPQFGQITSGSYKPTNYKPSMTGVFPSPAPAPEYSSALSAFKGLSSANGKWKLYVVDDSLLNDGTIASWTLKLWTTPGVAVKDAEGNDVTSLTMAEDGSATVAVIVKSSSTAAASLTLTGTSSDTYVVTNVPPGLVFGGSGENRTLTITPFPNMNTEIPNKGIGGAGPLTIAVTVKDEATSATATDSFSLTITNINDAPTIVLSTNKVSTAAGQLVSVAILVNDKGEPVGTAPLVATVDDIDNPPDSLRMEAWSSNTNVVSNGGSQAAGALYPVGGVFFSGTGGARNFTIVPKGAATGTSTLKIYAGDPTGAWTPAAIDVAVVAPSDHRVFANYSGSQLAPPIVVNATGPATPSSSTADADVGAALIGKVTVSLTGLKNITPSALTVVLKGPHGQQRTLMSGMPGATAHDYAQITFDDAATATSLPDADTIENVTVKPTESLSALVGTDAKGTWKLEVSNNSGSAGLIQGGWVLNVYPGPVINGGVAIGDKTIDEDTSLSINFPVTDQFKKITSVTAVSSNPALVPNDADHIKVTPGATLTNLWVKPALHKNSGPDPVASNNVGDTTITLTATDESGYTVTSAFKLTVKPVNDAPTISPIGKQTTRAGIPTAPASFTIGDVDNLVDTLTVSGTSDNPKLLPNINIVLAGSGADWTVTLYPVSSQVGNANVTVTVSDGSLSASSSFVFSAIEAGNPLYDYTSAITFNDYGSVGSAVGKATPYPAAVSVSGMLGLVTEVRATIFGLVHPQPSDINILLVGPHNEKLMLMAGAGGSYAVTNTQLLFSDNLIGTTTPAPNLPSGSQIVSGNYAPTVVGAMPTLPDTPAGTTYTSFAAAFNGINPNGTWSLYVQDSTAGPSIGYKPLIAGGWQLSIRTGPVISKPIPDQVTDEDVAKRVPVTVGDQIVDRPFVVTATADNKTLIPDANISVPSSGAVRTLTITPAANQNGSAIITVAVTDPVGGGSDSASFKLTVNAVDDPPAIAGLADNYETPASVPVSLSFTVSDPETADPSVIPVEVTSENQGLVRNADIKVAVAAGTRTLTITPVGVQTGTAKINVTAKDGEPGSNLKTTKSFVLTVTPNVAFANLEGIVINDNATATPYPSVISVRGVAGLVRHVTVTLIGFNHPYPDDVDVMLVSPVGDKKGFVLMSGAGGGNTILPANSVRLTFDDRAVAEGPIPDNAALNSQKYQPADWKPSQPFPGTPGRSSATTLDGAFAGISPNGDWKLYVLDDTYPDAGAISGGWIITFETSPEISPIGSQTMQEDVPLYVRFTVGDADTDPTNLLFSVATGVQDVYYAPGLHSADNLIKLANMAFDPAQGKPGTARTLIITNTPNLFGTVTNITVKVSDGTTENSVAFPLTVVPVDDPPTGVVLSGGNPVSTVTIDEPLTDTAPSIVLQYRIGDLDSTVGASNVTVRSSLQSLVPDANIAVLPASAGADPNTTVTLNVQVTNNLHAVGTTVLTFSLTDRTSTITSNVTYTVRAVNNPPTISAIADTQTGSGQTTTNILFTVSDVETLARNLVVTATSSNEALVPNSNIVLGGAEGNRFIRLTPVAVIGTAQTTTITVTVSDGDKTASTSFLLTVQPDQATSFVNSVKITIRDNNTADVYPSVITVHDYDVRNASGDIGKVAKVRVTLQGFTHTAPDDVDILLVGPQGQKALLISDVGGRNPVNSLRLTFDDSASVLGDDNPILSGTYHPSNYENNTDPISGAPAGPYEASLAVFNGTDPVGDWKLYVVDDTSSDAGEITQGWVLSIDVAPTLVVTYPVPGPGNPDGAAFFTEDTTFGVGLRIGNLGSSISMGDLAKGLSSATAAPVPAVSASFSAPSAGGDLTATLNPAANANGTNKITFTLTRADGARTSATVPISIAAVNDPPTISRLTTKTTQENVPLTIVFIVSDVDTPVSDLKIEATSLNTAVISTTNLVFFGGNNILDPLPANELRLTLTPNLNTSGTANIALHVQDKKDAGSYADSVFPFVVQHVNQPPSISAIPTQATPSGTPTTNIVFTVSDPDSASLTITASSSDQALVKNSNIEVFMPDNVTPGWVGAPGERRVRVTPEPGLEGSHQVTITLTVSDGTTAVPGSFTLLIRPSRERVFTNNKQIMIQDNATADTYPSQINVSGLVGSIAKVRVILDGFKHSFPDDVDMLLVGPDNQKVVIMSDAGGGVPVSSLLLKLEDGASAALPDNSALTSGAFQPQNYEGNSTDNFPAPAPARPYVDNPPTFATFAGGSPNGLWSLYIIDDTPTDSGTISNGWSVAITTQPIIMGLPTAVVVTPEDTLVRVPFTIVEESFAGTDFTFGSLSTNTTVVASQSVTFQGAGTNWTAFVTPLPNAFGQTEISILCTNADAQVVSNKFVLSVTSVNDAPTITQVPNQTISAGGVVNIVDFNYNDVETPKKVLIDTLAKESSNPALIPTSNIYIVGNVLIIVPVGNQTGTAQITLTITDEGGLTAKTSFIVTVLPSETPLFANSGAIVINDNAKASPYPSTINVSKVTGSITKVTVTLAEMTHRYPDDVDVLLVGPQGQKVTLMSDAGGGGQLTAARLTFDDSAASSLPDNTQISSGVYKPTNYEGADSFPDTPAGAVSASLSAFNGTDPNGTWSLYVMDDASPDAGLIAGGWLLNITTTSPTITPVPDQVLVEDVSKTVTFRVDDPDTPVENLGVDAITDNQRLISLAISGTGNDKTLLITPLPNANSDVYGPATVTLSVTDGAATTSTSFKVVVSAVNDAPTIDGLTNQRIEANRTLNMPFTVGDVETPADDLTLKATSSNANLGTVSIGGSGTSRVLTFKPSGIPEGNTSVDVTVSDGLLTVTNTIVITVIPPRFPIISPIADQTGVEDVPTVVPFTIGNTTSTNLIVVGTANNPDLVASVAISGTGFTRAAVIVTVPNANSDLFGTATITLVATDEYGSGTNSFKLTVTPVDDPPVLGPIADQQTTQNVPVQVVLTVSDVDDAITNLTFQGTSSNPGLVSNVTFVNDGSKVTATVNLVPNATGLSTVTISASDRHSTVSQSFALLVTGTPPTISAIEDQTTDEDTVLEVPFTVGNTASTNFTLVASASNTNLVSSVDISGTGFDRAAQITLVTNANSDLVGTSTITLVVGNDLGSTTNSFKLTVNAVNDAPVVTGLSDQTVAANHSLTVNFTVSDVESPATDLTASASVSNPSLGSAKVSGTGTARTLTFTPLCVAGNVTVSVIVSDGGASTTNSIVVHITPAVTPSISAIADKTVFGVSTVEVPFTVADGAPDLTVAGAASNGDLVSAIDIVGTGGSYTAVIALVPGATGSSVIYIAAGDMCNSTTATFHLTVKPVPFAPIISDIADLTVPANAKVEVPFTVSHVAGSTVVVAGSASNAELISAIDIVQTPTNYIVTLTLVKDATGKSSVFVTASDEYGSSTESFELNVRQAARAYSIGLNFGADEANGDKQGTLAATAVAGVPAVAQPNWNNLSGISGTNTSIIGDVAGVAQPTSVTVSWTCPNTWSTLGRGETNNAFVGPDRTLMLGYLDTGSATTTPVTITGLPEQLTSAGYDVYVYALGGVAGRGGGYRILDANSKVVLKDYVRAQAPSNPSSYIKVEPSADPTVWAVGNYIVFSGLDSANIIVESTTTGTLGYGATKRAPINAIQLVSPATSTPPPKLSIVRTPSGVTITFTGTLQQADQVTGPYTDVPNATSPFNVDTTSGMKYYRSLKQ